jgi:hypothetical protein
MVKLDVVQNLVMRYIRWMYQPQDLEEIKKKLKPLFMRGFLFFV